MTYSIPRVIEESVCRSAKDYRFTDIGIYKIHTNTLLPNIEFEEAVEQPNMIDKSIFINDEETIPILLTSSRHHYVFTCITVISSNSIFGSEYPIFH